MTFLRENTTKAKIALLLIVLLVNTLVIKPVHYTVVQHGYTCYNTGKHQQSIQNEGISHKDCDICHFIFSLCTPQDISEFAVFVDRPYILVEKPIQTLNYSTLLRYFSLRAPPTIA